MWKGTLVYILFCCCCCNNRRWKDWHSMWFSLGDTQKSRLLLDSINPMQFSISNTELSVKCVHLLTFSVLRNLRYAWKNICMHDICDSIEIILQNRSIFHASTKNIRRKHVKAIQKKIIYIVTIKYALLQYLDEWILILCMFTSNEMGLFTS